MIKEALQNIDWIRTVLSPGPELRYINWYLQHGCDLDCYYCRVPKQKVRTMSIEERHDVLAKIRKLSAKHSVMTIIGGEPTLRPSFLVEAVDHVAKAGFFVNVVSNGWGLTPELITQLGQAGLGYLAISVDADKQTKKQNLHKALDLLTQAKRHGIVPVVNTVITSKTDIGNFKQLARAVINKGCWITPLACSPEVPGGVFSSASPEMVPTREQLREVVPWLAYKKATTGRVATSFGYLWTLYHLKTSKTGNTELWHCSSHFRSTVKSGGRGYLTLDADGYIGPCQEFPRVVNLLDIPIEEVSLQLLDPHFSETTEKCSGCVYNCYINEEELQGPKSLAEVSSGYQVLKIFSNKPK